MTEQNMRKPPNTPQSSMPGKIRKALRWMAISVAGLLAVLILVVVIVIASGIPVELDWVKGKIETAASEATGRRIAIEGPLTLVASMPPAVQIEGVRVGNPEGWPRSDLVRLDLARARLRVLPLLKGDVLVDEITVDGLHVKLETNVEGEPNWLLAEPGQGPEPESGKESEPSALKFIELVELSLHNIVVTHRDAATGKTFELKLEEITGSAENQKPMQLLMHGVVQQEPYEVTFTGGSLAALVEARAPWPLDFSATALGTRLTVSGEIAEPLRGKGLALGFDLSGPSMADLEVILGTRLPPIQSFTLKGRIEEAEGKYRLADLEGDIAATAVTASFEADIAGEKPRLVGDIDIRRLDAAPFFAVINKQEQGRAEAAQQPEQAEQAASAEADPQSAGTLDIDETILTLDALDRFDARFKVTIHEVVNAPTSLNDASLEMTVSDGTLSAPLAVTLAEVPFKGELSLLPEAGQPRVAVTLAAEQSDIGGLAALLSGRKDIRGKFDFAQLDLSASGETIGALVESAELRFALTSAFLSYGHDSGGKPVEFTLDAANLRFPAAEESRITAQGSLLGEAFAIQLKGGTFIENFLQRRWPLELTASGGGAELSIGGTVRPAEGDVGAEFDFALKGGQIGALAAWLGVSPQASQSYALKGKVTDAETGIRVQVDEASIGKSAFAGEAGIREEGETPITFAKLNFRVLDLKALRSLFPETSETEEPKPERVGRETLTIDVPILPQGIEIFDSDLEIALARIKLEPADITGVSVSATIRDGYMAEAPIAAIIAGTRFDGRFGIDLRGETPKVDLRIQSRQVNVGTLLAQLGVVEGLAVTAGRFDLALALEGASTREMLQRSSFRVGVRDGAWTVSAPGAEQGLNIRVPEAAISAKPGQPIRLAIDGRIDKIPVQIQITTDTLGSFAEPKKRLEMDVDVDLAKARLKLSGAAPVPVREDNLHFAMDLSGKRFSDFDELLDADLPPIGPYRLRGEFGSRPSGYYVQHLQLTVGESTLTGQLDLKTAQRPPRLDMELVAQRIQLDDFDTGDWSVTGEDSKARDEQQAPGGAGAEEETATGGRSIVSPDLLRSLNAKVDVKVDEVLSGQDNLGRGTLTATLENGRFAVDPLSLDIPGGLVDLSFAFTPTDRDVALEANAKVEKLDYGILARHIDPESETGGVISVDLDLKTRGPDLDRVMEDANGHIDFGIWPEDLNADIFDLWAVNVITALVSEVDKDKASKLNCVILRFRIDEGLMQDRVVFADTSKMRVEGSAQVDFKRRVLKVYAAPKGKRPEFFSLAVPVGLSGQFEDFRVDVDPVVLAGKAISFVTSPVHVPLRRIFKKGEPADGSLACAEAWRSRVGNGEVSAPAPE